jgi:hypothetical protein
LKQDKRNATKIEYGWTLSLSESSTGYPSPCTSCCPKKTTLCTPTPPPGARASPIDIDAPPKRARVDPSVDPGKSNHSPLALSEEYIKSHIHRSMKDKDTLLLNCGSEHLVLSQHILFSKERSQIRIDKNDAYIPVLARVNFCLQGVQETEELPEYLLLLQNRTADIVKIHQEELQVCIVDSIKLDIKAMWAARNQHYCKSLHKVASLFHIAQGLDVEHTHHTVIALLSDHSEALLKHTGLPADEFSWSLHDNIGRAST